MALTQNFEEIKVDELLDLAQTKQKQGYRFVQMLCVMVDAGIDCLYSFMKDGVIENYTIVGIDTDTQHIPSVTEYFLSAFPFENEAHDLFGVQIDNIAIDFQGDFYMVAMDKPMTVISPEQKAAREKAAKIAAAKAARAAKAKRDAEAKTQNDTQEKDGE